jgi:hypothetical protein
VAFAVVVALMFVSGLASCWFIPLQALFMSAVPPALRGRAFGVAISGLWAVQGLGVLAAGAVAERLSPGGVVAAAGVIGLAAVVPAVVALGRSRPAVAAGRPAGGASVA